MPTETYGMSMWVVAEMMLITVSGGDGSGFTAYRGIGPVAAVTRGVPVALNAVPVGANVTVAVTAPGVKGIVAVAPAAHVVQAKTTVSAAVRFASDAIVAVRVLATEVIVAADRVAVPTAPTDPAGCVKAIVQPLMVTPTGMPANV